MPTPNTNHMMLDIETLGTKPGSIILAIGAVMFDPFEGAIGDKLIVNLQVSPQDDAGLTTSASTVEWWSQQSAAAKAHLTDPPHIHPDTAMAQLSHLYMLHKGAAVWGHGATFDVVLVEQLYAAFKLPVPWKFYHARDTRTLFDVSATEVQRDKGTPHYALDDAERQAEAVCEAYHALGLTSYSFTERWRMALRKARTGQFYDWSAK